jgi:FkbM family methyltransferase
MKEKKLKSGCTFYYDESLGMDYSAVFNETNIQYKHYTPKDTDIILDAGANVGDMPLNWGRICKEIHSYEPMKTTFDIMKYNVERNDLKKVNIYEAAIGHGTDPITMWINEKARHGSLCSSSITKRGRTPYTVQKLDFNSEVRRIKPNVIKMDIEGGEREILENIDKKALKCCEVFFIELHPMIFRKEPDWEARQVEILGSIFKETNHIFDSYRFKNKISSFWKFSR